MAKTASISALLSTMGKLAEREKKGNPTLQRAFSLLQSRVKQHQLEPTDANVLSVIQSCEAVTDMAQRAGEGECDWVSDLMTLAVNAQGQIQPS